MQRLFCKSKNEISFPLYEHGKESVPKKNDLHLYLYPKKGMKDTIFVKTALPFITFIVHMYKLLKVISDSLIKRALLGRSRTIYTHLI